MKILSFILVSMIFMLNACKNPPTPPPVPVVDLSCDFSGIISTQNGDSSIFYNDSCTYSFTKSIFMGSPSNAQYKTNLWNASLNQGIEVEVRSIYWDDDGSHNPSSTEWQSYFNSNLNPNYSPSLQDDGIILKWIDSFGRVWVSDTSSLCFSNFAFNGFEYDADTTGEYMKFEAMASGVFHNSDIVQDSSICFSNFHIISAFRRD